MHKNCHKSYLDSEPALHKCRVDKFLEVLSGAPNDQIFPNASDVPEMDFCML